MNVKFGNRWHKIVWAPAFFAVVAIAGWTRLARFRGLFPGGEIVMLDGDSAYHFHRILETVRRFPSVPTFDPWMNWPSGAICPWAAGFDLAGASWVVALGGGSDPSRAKLLIALFPVILGILVVWTTIGLARRLIGNHFETPWMALVAGLFAAVIPQGVASSLLGRSDHHVAETLSVVLLTLWCIRAVPESEVGPRSRFTMVLWEIEGTILVAGSLFVFAGACLYVAITATPLLALLAFRREPTPILGSGTSALLAGAALAGLLSISAIRTHGHLLSFMSPSLLQPIFVATGGGLLLLGWIAPRLSDSLKGSVAARFSLSAAACAAAAVALATLAPVRSGLVGWLLHRDPWIASISEFQPLWNLPNGTGLIAGLNYFFGVPGFAVFLSLPLAAVSIIRHHRVQGVIFVGITTALFVLTFLQNRFGRVLVPFLAIASALALKELVRLVTRRTGGNTFLAEILPLTLAVVWITVDPRLRRQFLPTPGHALLAHQAAAFDLRDAPPVARGAGSGVLAPWHLGHDLEVLGGRPVLVNGFGSYIDAEAFAEAEGAFRLTVPQLLAMMERRDLGFIVTGPLMLGHAPPFRATPGGSVLDLDALRASPLAPFSMAGSGVPGARVKHLQYFLPRFASKEAVGGLAFALPALWIYERVPGAILRGSAAPRTLVSAELSFHENGRPHVWKAWTDVDDSGHWELVLPVPSGYFRPTLWTNDAWSVGAGGSPIPVSIPEIAVRRGLIIEAGNLLSSDASGAATR